MLNFVEFKNFMGKRKSLPDKVKFPRVDLVMTNLDNFAGTGTVHIHLVTQVGQQSLSSSVIFLITMDLCQ